jgi:hypothetical protein
LQFHVGFRRGLQSFHRDSLSFVDCTIHIIQGKTDCAIHFISLEQAALIDWEKRLQVGRLDTL